MGRRFTRIYGFVFAALIPLLSLETPTRELDIRYDWYDVEGDTVEQIRQSMIRLGPKDINGKNRFALTSWTVRWTWARTAAGKPDLASARVNGSIVVTLPRWAPTIRSNAETAAAWDVFLAHLIRHESNHVRNIVQQAAQIPVRLREAATANLSFTAQDGNQIALSILESIRAFDREYDRRTIHGKTEGAWLGIPPAE